MTLTTSLKELVKRFFFGTPNNEVNTSIQTLKEKACELDVKKMEVKYVRYQLAEMTRKYKKLELEIKYSKL